MHYLTIRVICYMGYLTIRFIWVIRLSGYKYDKAIIRLQGLSGSIRVVPLQGLSGPIRVVPDYKGYQVL
jgi:hypothetical protein